VLAIGPAGAAPSEAQTQTAALAPAEVAPPPPGKLFSDGELDELVARIALYPDPLLALVMPASTNGLQIVQAQRFLDANTGEEPPESWDPAIVSLMNYPEVVQMMSDDLDWTQALGDAVAAQQADVMDAVQQVRAQAQAAGNLETTEQQKVVVEREVVKIVPADPEVIYVPQYDPQVIYAPAPAPVVSYYPPRPCYWCSAAAFGTGMFIGATTAMVGAAITAPFWAFDWHHHDIGWGFHGGHNDFDFDIDRDIDINNNISNINKNVVNKGNGNQWKPDKNRPGSRPGGGGSANRPNRPNRPEGGWNNPNRPGAKPGGRPGGGERPSAKPARPGDRPGAGTRPGAGGGGVQRPGGGKDRPGGVAGRPSARPGGGKDRPGMSSGGASRPSTPSSRPSTRPGGQKPTREAKGMGSYGRGRDSVKQSQRGSSSRQKSSMGSSRQRSGSGSASYKRSSGGGSRGKSMSGYKGGSRSSAHSSRGSHSRGGGGGGRSGGGGRGGGGGGGGRRR
jgi:hypothetical protein